MKNKLNNLLISTIEVADIFVSKVLMILLLAFTLVLLWQSFK